MAGASYTNGPTAREMEAAPAPKRVKLSSGSWQHFVGPTYAVSGLLLTDHRMTVPLDHSGEGRGKWRAMRAGQRGGALRQEGRHGAGRCWVLLCRSSAPAWAVPAPCPDLGAARCHGRRCAQARCRALSACSSESWWVLAAWRRQGLWCGGGSAGAATRCLPTLVCPLLPPSHPVHPLQPFSFSPLSGAPQQEGRQGAGLPALPAGCGPAAAGCWEGGLLGAGRWTLFLHWQLLLGAGRWALPLWALLCILTTPPDVVPLACSPPAAAVCCVWLCSCAAASTQ